MPKSLDLSQASASMQRIVVTRSLDFDRILGAERETVETKFEGLGQALVVDQQSSEAAVVTMSMDLDQA